LKLSVVMPVYNEIHTIEEILHQVRALPLELEIIVVDDGSTDDTHQMVERSFPGCRYLHQPNRGVSSARNLGIEASRGEWVALLDSDDEWLPEKLANQLQLLTDLPDHPLCHTEEIWVRKGRRVNAMKKHAKSGGWIFLNCLPLCVISPSSVLIRRSLFDEIGLFDESLPACEDYDLWLRICARHPVAYLETPQIVKYGGHADQLSQKFWGMDRFRIRALEKIIGSGAIDGEQLPQSYRPAVGRSILHSPVETAWGRNIIRIMLAVYSVGNPAPRLAVSGGRQQRIAF